MVEGTFDYENFYSYDMVNDIQSKRLAHVLDVSSLKIDEP